ncbi:hypothetical protein CEXT_418411, partial [Caerostris extrusa]
VVHEIPSARERSPSPLDCIGKQYRIGTFDDKECKGFIQ